MQRQIAMVLALLIGVGLAAPAFAPVDAQQRLTEKAQTDDGYLQFCASYGTYWYGDFKNQGIGVKLTPAAYPVRVTLPGFYFSGAGTSRWRTRIYDDDGTSGAPGTVLYDTLLPSQVSGWNSVNITDHDLRINSGSFYVFMYWDTMIGTYPRPYLGLDNNGRTNPNPNWYDSMEVSGTHHYVPYTFSNHDPMIRAYVVDLLNDVGVTHLLTPSGTIDSTASVTPACSVYNFGRTTQASYNVRMRIGSCYDQTATVTSHAGGTAQYVEFPTQSNWPRGSFGVVCSTALTGDQAVANDSATGSVDVAVHDAAVLSITAPSGAVDSGASVVPSASVANYGSVNETFDVVCDVGAWSDTQTVTINAGAQQTVDFASWTALERGENPVAVRAELATDMVTANDDQSGSVTVDVHDVATAAILAPTGVIEPGSVIPQATVRNNGTLREACTVTFNISSDPAYSEAIALPDGLPFADTTLDFPAWTATPGTYTTGCAAELTGDQVPLNNSLGGEVAVELGLPAGWAELAPVPTLPSGKAVKDGGWLTYDGGTGRIFVVKGYKAGDFYSFDIGTEAWTQLADWPVGTEAKGPYKGSIGCSDGNGTIYATKGNNTPGFWKYSDSGWTQLADVPLGLSNKKVKGGTDMVYVTLGESSYVYLLKGYKTKFYRYNTGTGVWQTLADAPAGVKPKWDKGSWLVHDPVGGQLLAHKAKFHELYAFDLAAGTWGPVLAGMPLSSGLTGKSKKAKDGSDAALLGGTVWALKGGNTQEFFALDVAGQAWTEKETIPAFGSTAKKKRVKAGGGIVTDGEVLYALKGNKTLEFWRYVAGAPQAGARPDRSGVLAGVTAPAVRLRVGPNPASDRLFVEYALPRAAAASVRVADITGRVVVSRDLAAGLGGSVQLSLTGLARGVYLVQFSSEGFCETAKLVVGR
ncbi:MAG: T9SS type A sorting domain-containing protein [bacterium]